MVVCQYHKRNLKESSNQQNNPACYLSGRPQHVNNASLLLQPLSSQSFFFLPVFAEPVNVCLR